MSSHEMDDDIILTTDTDFEILPQKSRRTARGKTFVSDKDNSPQKENASSCVSSVEHTNTNTTNQAIGSGQPRKTARRGLARKLTPDLTASTSSDVTKLSATHRKASVYSTCVSHGFQNMYGSQSPHDIPGIDAASEELLLQEKNLEIEARLSEGQELSDSALTSGEDSGPNQTLDGDEVQESGNQTAGESLRSPTPPPELQNTKQHRMSRRLQKALKTLNTAKARLDKQVVTPPGQRGRRKGRQAQGDSSIILLADSPAHKADMVVKVRYLSTVHRLPLNLNQPFHILLRKLSQELGKPERNLSLFLRDSSLPLTNTPRDVHLSVADIIECYDMAEAGGEFLMTESVNVTIQSADRKQKASMEAFKRLPLRDLMDRYAEKFDLNVASFRFSFDGEDVNPEQTPLQLDMEDGDVLDVVPLKDKKKARAYARDTQVITLI